MTIGDIEVSVYTDADPEKEMQKALYAHFRETNWMARNQHLIPLIAILYCTIFFWWVMGIEADQLVFTHGSPALVIPAVGLIGCATLGVIDAAILYFAHERPWKKYKDEWTLTYDENEL